jgi:hypothetical protein
MDARKPIWGAFQNALCMISGDIMPRSQNQKNQDLVSDLIAKIEVLRKNNRLQASQLDTALAEIEQLKATIQRLQHTRNTASAQQPSTVPDQPPQPEIKPERRRADRRNSKESRRSTPHESSPCWDRRLGDRRSNLGELLESLTFS